MEKIVMRPIGYVKNDVENKKDVSWGDDASVIELQEEFYSGLAGLEDFSHATIIFYLDKAIYEKEKHYSQQKSYKRQKPGII